jgi:D-serine deaminase-like pyridoxal phosphate-dependent protein
MPDGRSGCRTAADVDEVARRAAASARLRLVGVAGYEAARGHDVTPEAQREVRTYLRRVRAAVTRLAATFETDDVMVTAGGSTYFDRVAEELTGGWPAGSSVTTVLRSGCYLTHDVGLYERTSPLGLRSALTVWAQATSRPEPDLALFTMGRRDVSEDQDLPRPSGLPGSSVTKLNDQHAYLRIGPHDRVAVGDWVPFGVSHPCTTFDKWALIPMIDAEHRVVDLIRTFF